MNLREALNPDLIGVLPDGRYTMPKPHFEVVNAAARRFLALTETGPDYGAAFDAAHHIIWIEMELEFSDDETMSLARRIVDAALADYLEDTDA